MEKPVNILAYDNQSATLPLMLEVLLRQILGQDEVSITPATLDPTPLTEDQRNVLAGLGAAPVRQEAPALASLGNQVFDLVIRISRPEREDDPQVRDQEEQAKKPLLVGDPITLCWELPSPAEGGPTDSSAVLADAAPVLRENVQALKRAGFLKEHLSQRRRIHRVLDALAEGIVAHDEYRCIGLFNGAAEKITGIKRDQVLGRDCHMVFGEEGICGAECLFRDGPRQLKDAAEYYTTFTSRDGEDHRIKMNLRAMSMGAGRFPGVVAVMHDVTEVNELRWQLSSNSPFHGTVGTAASMQEIYRTIRQVAGSDYSVLVSGESGTGKELAARAIHAESRRSRGPFVPINCGALPENILESELFGHVRGAFTGAVRDKKGRFELAHKGTLFLDEVGELTPAFQVKLLRVLQERKFELVGGERSVSVDVRIIAATNQDLRQMVSKGDFREDLFYRLCVVPITLPPLRRRLEDLPLLVEHFLGTIRKETGKDILQVSDEALEHLLRHRWPGNIRELINALQFGAVRCQGEEILAHHLPPEVRDLTAGPLPARRPRSVAPRSHLQPGGGRYKLEQEAVEHALAQSGGNKVKAAKILGVGRATLYRYLNRHPVS